MIFSASFSVFYCHVDDRECTVFIPNNCVVTISAAISLEYEKRTPYCQLKIELDHKTCNVVFVEEHALHSDWRLEPPM